MDDITRHTAEQQVDAFIRILSKRYGVEEKEIPELIQSLRWATEHKATIKTLSVSSVALIISTILGGIIIGVWEFGKQLLGK